MKIKEKFKNKKRELTLILIISIVILFFFSGFSMGKELSKTTIAASTKIAKPILEVENNKEVYITNLNNKECYEFKVKNYNKDGEVSQIEQRYNVEILQNVENAISLKIYKNNQEIKLESNKTEYETLKGEEKQEDNYKIEISYDKEKNVLQNSIIEQIQIKVHAEQEKS